jgi:hypothetical protein
VLNGQLTNSGTVGAGSASANANTAANPLAILAVKSTSPVMNQVGGSLSVRPDGDIELGQLENNGTVNDNGVINTTLMLNFGNFSTTNLGAMAGASSTFLNLPGANLNVGNNAPAASSLNITTAGGFLNDSGATVTILPQATLTVTSGAFDQQRNDVGGWHRGHRPGQCGCRDFHH